MLSARNQARLVQANRMSRRGAAAVARATRESRNRHYGRHVHPSSTAAAKLAMSAVRQGFADSRAYKQVAPAGGMHGTPLDKISTQRIAGLISGFVSKPRPLAHMGELGRASMSQGYHGPSTMREMPVQAFRERGARRMTVKRVGAKSANQAKAKSANRAKAKTMSKGKARAKSA